MYDGLLLKKGASGVDWPSDSVHEQITLTVTLGVIPLAKAEGSFLKDLGGGWGRL